MRKDREGTLFEKHDPMLCPVCSGAIPKTRQEWRRIVEHLFDIGVEAGFFTRTTAIGPEGQVKAVKRGPRFSELQAREKQKN